MGAKDVALPKSRAGKWETKGALFVPDIQGYIASLLRAVEEGDSDQYCSSIGPVLVAYIDQYYFAS